MEFDVDEILMKIDIEFKKVQLIWKYQLGFQPENIILLWCNFLSKKLIQVNFCKHLSFQNKNY